MDMQHTSYGMRVEVPLGYDQAVEKARDELSKEGFGVLTEIDVKATMKEKLDIDFRPYSILGACNPPIAHRVLSHDATAGLLLPCNITVESESDHSSIVRIANPEAVFSVGTLEQDPELSSAAQEARQKLERVAEALLAS